MFRNSPYAQQLVVAMIAALSSHFLSGLIVEQAEHKVLNGILWAIFFFGIYAAILYGYHLWKRRRISE